MNIIRKISVGPDYMKCMHYVVGQEVLGRSYIIDSIIKSESTIAIWIKKDDELVMWKEFSNTVPVSLEFKIDF